MAEKTGYTFDDIFDMDYSLVFAWQLKEKIEHDISKNYNELNN